MASRPRVWIVPRAALLLAWFFVSTALAGPTARSAELSGTQLAVDQAVLDDLAPTGELRAAMNLAQPAQAFKDPASGELRGIAYDLSRELAARLGVPFTPIELLGPPPIVAGLTRGDIDVAVFALGPALAEQFDLSGPYLELDETYLLAAESPLRSIEEVDRPGVRVATGVSVPPLENAEVIVISGAGTNERLVQMLASGEADAIAASRPQLIDFAAQLPGSRVLDERFDVRYLAMAVLKGHEAGLSYLTAFVEDARASGFVQESIERNGTQGVQVAAPSV